MPRNMIDRNNDFDVVKIDVTENAIKWCWLTNVAVWVAE